MARRKAADAGIEADFRQADIFDLPADVVDLDLIYLSWGAICWVPDLSTFARSSPPDSAPATPPSWPTITPLWEVSAFTWPTSDVITALLAAGLDLTTFTDSPAPALGPTSNPPPPATTSEPPSLRFT